MLTLHGSTALSSFRCQKLAKTLEQTLGKTVSVAADWVYFVETSAELDEHARSTLEALLLDGENAEVEFTGERTSLLVVPRLGTTSPWSSKATDICHVCGLTRVKRVERGLRYTLGSAERLSEAELELALPHLHDR